MPPAKDPQVLNRLKQVFGAMPPHLTAEFKKTDQYIKQLKVMKRRGTSDLLGCCSRRGRTVHYRITEVPAEYLTIPQFSVFLLDTFCLAVCEPRFVKSTT